MLERSSNIIIILKQKQKNLCMYCFDMNTVHVREWQKKKPPTANIYNYERLYTYFYLA